jgi:hypothetical protein
MDDSEYAAGRRLAIAQDETKTYPQGLRRSRLIPRDWGEFRLGGPKTPDFTRVDRAAQKIGSRFEKEILRRSMTAQRK